MKFNLCVCLWVSLFNCCFFVCSVSYVHFNECNSMGELVPEKSFSYGKSKSSGSKPINQSISLIFRLSLLGFFSPTLVVCGKCQIFFRRFSVLLREKDRNIGKQVILQVLTAHFEKTLHNAMNSMPPLGYGCSLLMHTHYSHLHHIWPSHHATIECSPHPTSC